MPILTNIATLVTCRREGGQDAVHPVEDAALVWTGGIIRWVGPAVELPAAYAGEERVDAEGALVIPGLIDSHTHLAFGGWRADEFAQRIRGVSYRAIAQAGGGILKTMRQTRTASEDALVAKAVSFLAEMVQLGVTTVEAKSGYGLNVEDELKLLRVYRRLAGAQPVRIVPTLLAAHVVPPEYADQRGAYVDLICDDLIPNVAERGLARFCDVFVEDTAFTPDEARRICRAGTQHGLRPKLHVDQLEDGDGARLAAEVGAVSADHLEYVSEEGLWAMAEARVVAVALPLATLYLNAPPFDARRALAQGVRVAVATDFNPGSAPSYSLPLALTLACTLCRLTPAEALKGATYYAACALDLEDEIGSLEPGKRADFVLLDVPNVDHWLYHYRPNAALSTYIGGERVA